MRTRRTSTTGKVSNRSQNARESYHSSTAAINRFPVFSHSDYVPTAPFLSTPVYALSYLVIVFALKHASLLLSQRSLFARAIFRVHNHQQRYLHRLASSPAFSPQSQASLNSLSAPSGTSLLPFLLPFELPPAHASMTSPFPTTTATITTNVLSLHTKDTVNKDNSTSSNPLTFFPSSPDSASVPHLEQLLLFISSITFSFVQRNAS